MSVRRIAVLATALLLAGFGVGLAAAVGEDSHDNRHDKGRSGWIEVADQP